MKTSAKTFLAVLVILLLAAGGYAGFVQLRHRALLDNGGQFSRAVSQSILDGWDTDYFRQVSSDTLLNSFDANGIRLMFMNFRRMGDLVSLGEAKGELVNASWLPSGEPLVARYYLDADFSNGPSQVYVELVEEGDTWKLLNFYIQTPILAE